jgi:redox-sensitive bicupin YhaK (pirin superfamily)
VSNLDLAPTEQTCGGSAEVRAGAVHERLVGREVPLGKTTVVNRTLPNRERRMVGAWCFVDHFGPDAVINMPGMRVPPHPHTGLQTVTWLLDGTVEHRDSLGNVQTIMPGQLNLMTAGRGISHSEVSPADRPPLLHGVQLWVALPDRDRDGEARFEHLPALPSTVEDQVVVTVLLGELAGARAPATVHTPIVGLDVELAAGAATTLELEPAFEHGALVLDRAVDVDGEQLEPGTLLYLGTSRDHLDLRAPLGGRMILLGGEPFDEEIVMWWNFVARSHEEIVQSREDWMHGDRFGVVRGYDGDPLPAPGLPNATLRPRGRVTHHGS